MLFFSKLKFGVYFSAYMVDILADLYIRLNVGNRRMLDEAARCYHGRSEF